MRISREKETLPTLTGRRITGKSEQNEILGGRSPVDPLVVWRFAPRKQWIVIRRPVVAGAKRPRQHRVKRRAQSTTDYKEKPQT